MNKHKSAAKRLAIILLSVAYFTLLPMLIYKYGIENNIDFFVNLSPYYFSGKFVAMWGAVHVAVPSVLFMLYVICYGDP